MSYISAIQALNISPKRYLALYGGSAIGTSILITVTLISLFPSVFGEGLGRFIAFSIPLYATVSILLYPLILRERIKNEINQNMHYFITHLGILATSDLDRKKMIEHLANRKEFGALAEEIRKIYVLMDTWNLSLAEASRIVAKKCPSIILADFLDRFAHAVDAGEDLEEFLKSEQETVMNQYAVMYEGALYDVENLKEIYVSLTISLVFVACFALILPAISGQDISFLMYLVIFSFIFAEILILYYLKVKVPKDPVWHSLKGYLTQLEKKYTKYLAISILGCVMISGLIIFEMMRHPELLEGARPGLLISAGITPMYILGRITRKEEAMLRRRDDNYGAFMRSLGGATAARGGMVIPALGSLQTHDFGPLTQNIKALYKRLKIRVDKERAWKLFSAETGSNLIDRFTDMFVEGLTVGGKADVIGEIIGQNVTKITGLRKKRDQTAGSMTGVFYGMMVGVSFSLFVTFQIVDMINTMFSQMGEISPLVAEIFPIYLFTIQYTPFYLLIILIAHALLSSLMIKIVDGGHIANIYTHFITMLWIGMITANLTEYFISPMLSV
jgi:flagellar protein FlaJ